MPDRRRSSSVTASHGTAALDLKTTQSNNSNTGVCVAVPVVEAVSSAVPASRRRSMSEAEQKVDLHRWARRPRAYLRSIPTFNRFLSERVPTNRFRLAIAIAAAMFLLVIFYVSTSSSLSSAYSLYPQVSSSPFTTSHEEILDLIKGKTPVEFSSSHSAIFVESQSVLHVDFNKLTSTGHGALRHERVLILTPLRNAVSYLPTYFTLLSRLTYPHEFIDLGFLVSDTDDDTLAHLSLIVDRLQSGSAPFNSVKIIEKDFGFKLDMDVQQRHAFSIQGERRKVMARARNYLLSAALLPTHSWVMWRDVDVVQNPDTLIEDLMAHDKDVVVPNVWFHRDDIEGRFDYNSWIDTPTSRKLLRKLRCNPAKSDLILAEGYPDYDTKRIYMARMGDWRKDQTEEIKLDGVGGVTILVRADVHRSGCNFPAYAFENQAETEGFGKMANRMGYRVIGLPNYVVWHIDTEVVHSQARRCFNLTFLGEITTLTLKIRFFIRTFATKFCTRHL